MTGSDAARPEGGEPGGGPAGGLFGLTVGRPVALMVVFVTLIVVGVIAYRRIPIQLLPDGFTEPEVNIWVSNAGASAQENEEGIARVVEEQLRTLTGIDEIESWSEGDYVWFDVDFDGQVDMNLAKAEVRDRLERARPLLPASADDPETWTESASSLPITFFGILLKGDEDTRDHLMEKVVVPRLEAVQGVGKVTVWGVLRDSVRILLDEDKVAAAQMDIGAVIRRLMQDNFAMPMGEVNDGGREILLRSDMRFGSVEEIANYPVSDSLKLKDVGRVLKVKSVGDSLSHIDGAIAYYGMASKDSQANVVEVSRAWEAALEDLKADPALDGRMDYMLFFLQGDMIEGALGQLRETATWGGLLALVVLLIFLRRVRLTLCVALSIPVSALLAIAFEYFSGGTFNVLTMTGITLGIGMLVDNAVVVVENIARLHQAGKSPLAAAVVGTKQIALAVTLATLTSVVVFLPLIFMTDNPMLRIMFGGLGIPLSVSLLASLLVAVIFLPVITARLLGSRPAAMTGAGGWKATVAALPARAVAWPVGGLRALGFLAGRLVFRMNRAVLAVFGPLRLVLALVVVGLAGWQWQRLSATADAGASLRPFGVDLGGGEEATRANLIAFSILAALAAGLALFGFARWRRRPALPPSRPDLFVPRSRSLIGMLSTVNRRLVAWSIEHRLAACCLAFLAFLSIVIPSSLMVVTPFGEDSRASSVEFEVQFNANFSLSEATDEVAIYEDFLESKRGEYGSEHWSCHYDERNATLALYWEQRKERSFFRRMESRVRDELPRVPGHTLIFYDGENASARSQSVVRFTLTGPDSAELERLGTRARRILSEVPGLSQVTTARQTAPDQINVSVDRDLAHELGVNTEAIQQTINWALRGFSLPRYQEGGREVPLLIEFDEEEVAGLSTLRDLSVFGGDAMVPLASVANLEFSKGTRGIYRRNGRTSFTLTAKVDDPLQVIPITEAGYRALRELELPRGYSFDQTDSARSRQQDEFAELQKSLLLSIVLVFLLMGILFESLLLPFSVLFTIPFAIMGAYWTLFLTGTPMDSMGWIGMIILAGVVVNNGIVLIDRIHVLRRSGVERAEAVVTGCGQRVRPIIMTALTTVCGLLPMIVAEPPDNNGFDYRALATIVAGGLIAATFFTLWVVPLVYTLLDDLSHAFERTWRDWKAAGTVLAPARAPRPAPGRGDSAELG